MHTRIQSIRVFQSGHRVEATIVLDDVAHRVFAETNGVPLAGCREALVAAALPLALSRGGSLDLGGPVDPAFARGIQSIAQQLRLWWPELHPVNLVGFETAAAAAPRKAGIAAFFSGGVDSMYTLIENREDITDLILIHGFDHPLEDEAICRETAQRLQTVADRFGKRLIQVRTNIPALIKQHIDWYAGAGGALAAVAHLLSGQFGRILVPAAEVSSRQDPCGIHPNIDPHWSTGQLQFVHDGLEARRFDKVARLTEHLEAMAHLHVCWFSRGDRYNCGKCEKCLRTMGALYALDALDPSLFAKRLSVWRVFWMPVFKSAHDMHQDNLKELRQRRRGWLLQWALRGSLARPEWLQRILRVLWEQKDFLWREPGAFSRRVGRRLRRALPGKGPTAIQPETRS